jgi:hypothetical protein
VVTHYLPTNFALKLRARRDRYVAALPFSSFHRTQAILELRFPDSYLLWDRSGALWRNIGRNFRSLKHQTTTPNQSTFFADDRFSMLVSLDPASITDNSPKGAVDPTIDIFTAFAKAAIETLEVKTITRVGNRYLYGIECKSLQEARKKAQSSIPMAIPRRQLFAIEPAHINPAFKLKAMTAR